MRCFGGSDEVFEHPYLIPISDSTKTGSQIYRGPNAVDRLFSQDAHMRTCYDIFLKGKSISGDNAMCLGTRKSKGTEFLDEYKWMSYGDVEDKARALGAGLVALDLVPELTFKDEKQQAGQFRFLSLYSKNRWEWHLLELAAATQGITVVPMYETLGVEGLNFICSQTKMTTICCAGAVLKHVLTAATPSLVEKKTSVTNSPITQQQNPQPNLPGQACTLRNAIVFDNYTIEEQTEAGKIGLRLWTLEEVENAGRASMIPVKQSESSDICLLMYTSGTTGNPKGVMVSHHQIISMLNKLETLKISLNKEDCLISYLPSAHVFDRMMSFVLYSLGGRIGFLSGDIIKLTDDCQALKPTIFPSVPRILTRFHQKIKDGVAEQSKLRQAIFNFALKRKIELNDAHPGSFTHSVYDSILSKVRNRLGGKIRLIICGAAPISAQILRDFRAMFACPVVEVYGMTETTGGGCLAYDNDPTPYGGVGGPSKEVEIKLESVEEMSYIADGSQDRIAGEICFRGPCVTPGYFRSEKLTAESIDKDGWLHSGDIGEVTDNGGIRVIDRKKNIFKLAQGEYLIPEKIEQVYMKSGAIAQIFLHGDSTEVYPVAVVVPNEDWLKQNHLDMSKDDMKDVKVAIKAAMDKAADQDKLLGFEKAKEIFVCKTPFSIDNNLLTPTMKIKRHEAKLRFASEIAIMYGRK